MYHDYQMFQAQQGQQNIDFYLPEKYAAFQSIPSSRQYTNLQKPVTNEEQHALQNIIKKIEKYELYKKMDLLEKNI